MFRDKHGLVMTAANAEAVAHYDRVVTEYLGFGRETGTHLKAALAADPELVLGHCIKGFFFLLFARPALALRAQHCLAAAEAAMAERQADLREQSHVAALAAWCAGDLRRAVALWENILLDHPRDPVALRLAHHVHFFIHDGQQTRDSVARVLHAWEDTMPDAGFVLGIYAFGLEEAGNYGAAEQAGRRAIEISPSDIWAVHAVAHVMEMQGRQREGVEWIAGLEDDWRGCNNFRYHVWWHRALFHLELREFDAVLDLYDREIRAEESEDYLDMSNAAALLWRLEDCGIDVGDRWEELADKSESRVDDHMLVFADAHYMMALAAVGREAAADRMLTSMRGFAERRNDTEAAVARRIGLPLCQAILANRNGEAGKAVDLLWPLRYEIRRIGGSHAQRDVFDQLLIQSAIRDGRLALARALFSERTRARPNSSLSWSLYADVLSKLEDGPGAKDAAEQAARALHA